MMTNQTEDLKIKDNELKNPFLPQDLSIYLAKDRWLWDYRCLNSEEDFGLTFDSSVDALCHFVNLVSQKLESPSFRKSADDFRDALNQMLEDCPYDDAVMENLSSIMELLDITVDNL